MVVFACEIAILDDPASFLDAGTSIHFLSRCWRLPSLDLA